MKMKEWAENEVKLACEREKRCGVDGFADYGCMCYESALKAFKGLVEDGHSIMSITITKDILNRLIEGKCLTPVEDTEDIWKFSYQYEEDGSKEYQCTRIPSLFKRVHNDGRITYHDNNRQVGVDINSRIAYHSRSISDIIEERFPIQMPYLPADKPYSVYTEDFLYDENNGDYDTRAFLYIITPEGTRIDLGIYKAEKDNKFVDITKEEYEERKKHKIVRN